MIQEQSVLANALESVCVVGLGTVGQPTAEYFVGRGIPTFGCDINPTVIETLGFKLQRAATSLRDLPLADIYIVTVDTSLRGDTPYVENVFKACAAIAA